MFDEFGTYNCAQTATRLSHCVPILSSRVKFDERCSDVDSDGGEMFMPDKLWLFCLREDADKDALTYLHSMTVSLLLLAGVAGCTIGARRKLELAAPHAP